MEKMKKRTVATTTQLEFVADFDRASFPDLPDGDGPWATARPG